MDDEPLEPAPCRKCRRNNVAGDTMCQHCGILDPDSIPACRLCHQVTKLSFEHVPHQSCDNASAVTVFQLAGQFGVGKAENILQRGHGYWSLCKHCNTQQGNFYGKAVELWYSACVKASTGAGIRLTHKLYPGRVFKGLLGMFLSADSDLTADAELRSYLQDRDSTAMPDGYRLFAFARRGSMLRSTGRMLPIASDGAVHHLSEIHSAAVGYVMSRNQLQYHPLYVDITHFSKYGHNDEAEMQLFLRPLEVNSAIAADYRTKRQIAFGMQPPNQLMGNSGFRSQAHVSRQSEK